MHFVQSIAQTSLTVNKSVHREPNLRLLLVRLLESPAYRRRSERILSKPGLIKMLTQRRSSLAQSEAYNLSPLLICKFCQI